MHKRYYEIAGFAVSLELLKDTAFERFPNLAPFEAASPSDIENPLLQIRQVQSVCEKEPEPLLVSDDEGFPRITIGKTENGRWFFSMAPLHNAPTSGRCVCSEDFSEAEFDLLESRQGVFTVNNVMMLLYALRTSVLGCLEVHASVIMKDGKAVAFLGKSGTGKSTHTGLWLRHIEGTELLNDDNPVIRCHKDGRVMIYGSPWSGKTPCYKKLEVPLAAVVRLSQAPYNKIERLPGIKAYACLYPSVSAYRPERTVADGIHSTIEQVALRVPFYHLECLPDADAARLSYSTVYAEESHT